MPKINQNGNTQENEILDSAGQEEDFLLTEEIVLARLFDDLDDLNFAEIAMIETEEGKIMTLIILPGVKYTEEKGFEKI